MELKAFFAYPNDPRISEAISGFVKKINPTGLVCFETWEEMQIGGKLLVSEICKKIDACNLFCADITRLNPNVLFEIGYAITRKKRIWLIRDSSMPAENSDFNQFKILTTLGYREYLSSLDIEHAYYTDLPHESLEETVYDAVIEPNMVISDSSQFFYLKATYADNASLKITSKIDELVRNKKLNLLIDDSREGVQPLAWYATNIYRSSAVVCHLTSIDREGSRIQNAKHSLAAGMAHGFEVPILLLIEESELLGPADYRDLMLSYPNSARAVNGLVSFLTPLLESEVNHKARLHSARASNRKTEDLARLQLGEPIAEHEQVEYIDNAFVETPAYRAALESTQHIFVGRKGTGKTASFRKLSRVFSTSSRNFVCEIKPLSYEFEAVVEVAKAFEKISRKGFLFETLWKFLIYSEIAKNAYEEIVNHVSGGVFDYQQPLLDLVEANEELIKLDFSARLDALSRRILESGVQDGATQDTMLALSEILHSGLLHDLLLAISSALRGRKKLVVLVDNLDQAWDKNDDVPFLAHFFLGLLNAQRRVHQDFRNQKSDAGEIRVSLCVFVRADIFQVVLAEAPEADKIPYQALMWEDTQWLRALADARIEASASDFSKEPTADLLWKKFFCPRVGERPLFDYIFSVIIFRPRDMLFFLRAALLIAVGSRHEQVEEADFEKAEEQYSNFAYQSFIVEMRELYPKIESLIEDFMGSKSVLDEDELRKMINPHCDSFEDLLRRLVLFSFLQIEVPDRGFVSLSDDTKYGRLLKACRNFAAREEGVPRFRIHPAFWKLLFIMD